MADNKNDATLEENFEKLEEIIAVLENPEISLADSFHSYSEGMELIKVCNEQLSLVEKEVRILSGQEEA